MGHMYSYKLAKINYRLDLKVSQSFLDIRFTRKASLHSFPDSFYFLS